MTIQKPLLAVLVCLMLAGCSQDLYSIERQYYRVQRQAKAILTNPDATPPSELAETVKALNEFLAKHPKSNVAVDSQFTIAQLYAATKEYDKAHDQLQRIRKTFSDSNVICAEAIFMRGLVYEEQKDWPSALAQYQLLSKEFQLTPRGMEAPLYIALKYKSKLQPDKMVEALHDAIAHYKQIVVQYPGTPVSLKAKMVIAQCYLELKEPESAISGIQSGIEEFKGKVPLDGMMLDIASIYYTQLKDKVKASETLNKIIAEYPKSQSSATVKRILEEINKDKK